MNSHQANERGLSLIEVLVATAILALAIVIALTVYDGSRKAYAKGENATEQQESVRIAFDRMTSDLRMAGFNANPDGNPDRPDEQLEGALPHAVILRADFDGSDAAANGVPEGTLGAGTFATVSTGNDEIVAYVLSKPDGTGPDTISFQADVREPARDGRVESVVIDNVVLDPVAPPYSLYRVTLNNDSATYGSPAFIVRTPVVENVRDLSFTYYDDEGTFADASNAIAENPEAKGKRSGLTRFSVSLVGMTRDKDLSYDDPSDALAPRNRKFELKGDVTPRNMRYVGVRDLNADVTPPTKPATPTLTPGHCKGLIVTWAMNPGADGVTQYAVSWGPSRDVVDGRRSVQGPPFFLDGLNQNGTYFVSIQAQDADGNISVPSDPESATENNLNKPSVPTGVTASTDQTYHVAIGWTTVTTNTESVPAVDPLAPRIRDLAGYRLYSSASLPFPNLHGPHSARQEADEGEITTSTALPYLNSPVVACQNRHYVLTAVDACGSESDPSAPVMGKAVDTHIRPRPPYGVTAHYDRQGRIDVAWRPSTRDLDGLGIRIEHYEIFRSAPIDGSEPPAAAVWDPAPIASVNGGDYDTYTDYSPPTLSPSQVLYYRVTAADECGNTSDPSTPARLECAFDGDVQFNRPDDGDHVSNHFVQVDVEVRNGHDTFTGVTISYVHDRNGVDRTSTPSGSGPSWTENWNPRWNGDYTITATVTNSAGCSGSASIEVTASDHWGH